MTHLIAFASFFSHFVWTCNKIYSDINFKFWNVCKAWQKVAKHGKARPSTAKHDQARPSTAKHGQAQPSTAKHGQAWPSTTKHGKA
jgi:hypothetical protein